MHCNIIFEKRGRGCLLEQGRLLGSICKLALNCLDYSHDICLFGLKGHFAGRMRMRPKEACLSVTSIFGGLLQIKFAKIY